VLNKITPLVFTGHLIIKRVAILSMPFKINKSKNMDLFQLDKLKYKSVKCLNIFNGIFEIKYHLVGLLSFELIIQL